MASVEILKDFFTYEVNFSGLAAGTDSVQQINIQADSDFELMKMTYFADIAAAAQTESTQVVPLCSVLILDSGSGRQLSDQAVPVPNLFGTGEIPFILPNSKIFSARSLISVTVNNFSAATTYNLKLSFIGVKRFKLNAA
jgi:hypothetical protein